MDKDSKKVTQLKSNDPEFYKKFVEEWRSITNKLKGEIEIEKENEVVITSQRISNNSVIFK